MVAHGLCGPAQAKQINYERRQMHTYYNKWLLGPRGSLLPCELKCQSNRSVPPTAPVWSIHKYRKLQDWPRGTYAPKFIWVSVADNSTLHTQWWGGLWLAEALLRTPSIIPHWMAERPLIGWGLFLVNGRATNYQRVHTNQVMDTQLEYTCLSISPAIPQVGGKPVT